MCELCRHNTYSNSVRSELTIRMHSACQMVTNLFVCLFFCVCVFCFWAKLIRNANIVCSVHRRLPVTELHCVNKNNTLLQLVHWHLFLFCRAGCGYRWVWIVALQKLTSGENDALADWESMWKQLLSRKLQHFLYFADGSWVAFRENVAKVSPSLRKWLPRPLERSSRGKSTRQQGFPRPDS